MNKMTLKTWWRQRSYWQMGAIIGLIYGVISVTLFYLHGSGLLPSGNPVAFVMLLFGWYFTYGIWFELADGFGLNNHLSLIVTVFFYPLIGMVIGFIYDLVKKL